jgi:hypothetical protein
MPSQTELAKPFRFLIEPFAKAALIRSNLYADRGMWQVCLGKPVNYSFSNGCSPLYNLGLGPFLESSAICLKLV